MHDGGVAGPPRWRGHAVVGALLLCGHLAACASRAPVVTAPRFPAFPYPAVPATLAGLPAARDHQRAWDLLQAGDLEGASTAFQAALASAPGFHPAAAGLGYVGLAQGEPERAIAGFDRALADSPAYLPALLGRGEALLAVDDVLGAVASFEAALAVDGSLPGLRARVEELRFGSLMNQVARARAAAAGGRDREARSAYQRVITASPDSAFLYLELAGVERRLGDDEAALARLEQAVQLDPGLTAAWTTLSDVYLERDDLDRAEQALLRAEAIDPGPEIDRRLAAVEERRRFAALPPEFRAIGDRETVTRGELAALLGVRFATLLERAGQGRAAIITDARGHWAYGWMIAVVQAEIMDADANYRFLPDEVVTRAELARVVARIIETGGRAPSDAPDRTTFSDLAPGHLSYLAAATAVATGVMEPLDRNSFQPARAVSGAEAIAAMSRLDALVGG